jgi:translocator protein
MSSQSRTTRDPRAGAIISLLVFLTIVYGVAYVANLANLQGLPVWYQTLDKPPWTPPPWLFAPVWTVLYGLMGVGAWLVWRSPSYEIPVGRKITALALFAIQLALNGLWPWLFFGWRQIGLAAWELGVLNVVVALTIWAFFRVNRIAGWLLTPYMAWILFALALNVAIARLNAPG